MPIKRESTLRSVAKWLLIVILVILTLIVLVFVFEFVRLLVDPSQRA